jgi:uncharacterized protein involved in response to NO
MNASARFALFAYGFRPFFLGTAFYAAWGAVGWILVRGGHIDFQPALPAMLWHAHEMVFGFLAAAVAGFLLTAVPNWTGVAPLRGFRLALLFALWVAGRIGAWTVAGDAPAIFAILDIGFLPALATWAGWAILERRLVRNLPLVGLLVVLSGANLAIHLDAIGTWQGAARPALHLAIGIVTVLITIIGGRIIPAFTQNALRNAGLRIELAGKPVLDKAAILSALLCFLAVAAGLSDLKVAGLAASAAILNFVRLLGWRPLATIGMPIVWVLHLGYAWLVAGFALWAISAGLGIGTQDMALHAITLGAFGTMILAVMSRASLGHTGRPIRADGWLILAYTLVSFAAAGRAIVGPILGGGIERDLIGVSGALWASGFAVFFVRFLPILAFVRPDGRAG